MGGMLQLRRRHQDRLQFWSGLMEGEAFLVPAASREDAGSGEDIPRRIGPFDVGVVSHGQAPQPVRYVRDE
jgi:hypothetical protein